MVSKGADVNAGGELGQTPLAAAAGKGYVNIVKLLFDSGTDVNANGGAALMSAVGSGHTDIVQLLLARGANVNAKRNDGLTALMSAVRNAAITQTLLDRGADPNAKTEGWGWTPLMMAARSNGDPNAVSALASKGADLEAKDIHGTTALMLAASEGNIEIVKALIANGADVNAKDEGGATALMAAAGSGRLETVRALLAAGADVNAKDNGDRTALTYAAGALVSPPGSKMYESSGDPAKNYNHDAVVRVLLAAGADVYARTNNGETALMLAEHQGRTATVKLLRKAGAR